MGEEENSRQGKETWRSKVVEPAVPGSAVNILGSSIFLGLNVTLVDAKCTPSVSAEQMAAARLMPIGVSHDLKLIIRTYLLHAVFGGLEVFDYGERFVWILVLTIAQRERQRYEGSALHLRKSFHRER